MQRFDEMNDRDLQELLQQIQETLTQRKSPLSNTHDDNKLEQLQKSIEVDHTEVEQLRTSEQNLEERLIKIEALTHQYLQLIKGLHESTGIFNQQ